MKYRNSLLFTKGFDVTENYLRATISMRPEGASQKKTPW